MAHEKVYGICEDKCQVEVLPKENCCPKSHSSTTNEYGQATSLRFGHVKLTNSLSSLTGSETGTAMGTGAAYTLYHKFDNYYTKYQVDNMLPADSGWKNLTLSSGVHVGTTGRGRPQYRKIGNKVTIRGSVLVTPSADSSVVIGTIPSGFRPTASEYALEVCSGTRIAQIFMSDEGELKLDWVANISDGSKITTTNTWVVVKLEYFVD